jgi:hypothetical protein
MFSTGNYNERAFQNHPSAYDKRSHQFWEDNCCKALRQTLWLQKCVPLRPLPVVAAEADGSDGPKVVEGFDDLRARAKLPTRVEVQLQTELLALGAAEVKELIPTDWTGLVAWSLVKLLEQRRVMQLLFGLAVGA